MICTYCPNTLEHVSYSNGSGHVVLLCPRCDHRDPELTIDKLGGMDSPLPGQK